MKMNLKYYFINVLFYFYLILNWCNPETITYFSTERPVISWFDKKYLKNLTMSSRRLSRRDPRHYVEIYVNPVITLDNNITMDFYFYQFSTNRYQPSFVELHFKFCDMINDDTIFGPTMRTALGGHCPYPPVEYHLKNLTIPYVPKGFPFPKGRIYCNITYDEGGSKTLFAHGNIDMEIKVKTINKH